MEKILTRSGLYEIKSPKFTGFDYTQVSGKELSYNNIVDSERHFPV